MTNDQTRLSTGGREEPATPAGYAALSSIEAALRALDRLERARQVDVSGPWSAHQILVHCAQSVEFSLSGYPRQRSSLFKATVGRVALRTFLRRGRLKHDRTAAIPEAPPLLDGTLGAGCARLRAAFEAFLAFEAPPMPHFAYGAVTKAEYEALHAMHLADHLDDFTIHD
jgi:hypothetical protein